MLVCLLACSPLAAEQETIRIERDIRYAAAQYARARALLEGGNATLIATVPQLLEVAITHGYVPAQKLLLDVWEGFYMGLAKEPEKAFEFVKKMATASDAGRESALSNEMQLEATYRFALYWERGFGCHADAKAACFHMKRAADAGLFKAKVEYARYLMRGTGGKVQAVEALRILREVSFQAPATPHVFFYLGFMCEHGLGLSGKKAAWARQFYEEGDRRNDARAINNLASLYERGLGIKRDELEALRLYTRAASLGNRDASANMLRLANKTGRAQNDDSIPTAVLVRRALLRINEYAPEFLNIQGDFKRFLESFDSHDEGR